MEGGCEAAAVAMGRSWNVQPDCWGAQGRWSWGSGGGRGSPHCWNPSHVEQTPSEAPERSLGAGPGAVWRPVFARLCRCEVAVLHCRCRRVAGKARLRWVLWLRALADYYYYCYHPQGGSPRVCVSQGPQARWPMAEAGTGAGGVPGGAGWDAGWDWGKGGSWWWGHWGERGAPDLLKHSVSSGAGAAASWRAEPPAAPSSEAAGASGWPGYSAAVPASVISVVRGTSRELAAVLDYWPTNHPWQG